MNHRSLFVLVCVLITSLSSWGRISCEEVKSQLKEGDIVFIGIDRFVFRKVALSQQHWSSHVGVAFKYHKKQGRNRGVNWYVYESTIPLSKRTPICDFLNRATNGKYAVKRLRNEISPSQLRLMKQKATQRLVRRYHTGFNFDGVGEFCSKYVHKVYKNAGIHLGEIVSLGSIIDSFPEGSVKDDLISFWEKWYFNHIGIPKHYRTLMPVSIFQDDQLDHISGDL